MSITSVEGVTVEGAAEVGAEEVDVIGTVGGTCVEVEVTW